jgi:hypothetical protein
MKYGKVNAEPNPPIFVGNGENSKPLKRKREE